MIPSISILTRTATICWAGAISTGSRLSQGGSTGLPRLRSRISHESLLITTGMSRIPLTSSATCRNTSTCSQENRFPSEWRSCSGGSAISLTGSYHVACAIYAGCDYFLSTDKRLLKYTSDKIKIMNPIDFIREMENYDD